MSATELAYVDRILVVDDEDLRRCVRIVPGRGGRPP
jgi:hypothetical protein